MYCTRESVPQGSTHPAFAVTVIAAYTVLDLTLSQNFGVVQDMSAPLPFGGTSPEECRAASDSASLRAGTECQDVATAPGYYWVNLAGTPFVTYCDVDAEGVWTLIAQEVGVPDRCGGGGGCRVSARCEHECAQAVLDSGVAGSLRSLAVPVGHMYRLDLQAPTRAVNIGPDMAAGYTRYRLAWRLGSETAFSSVNFQTNAPLFQQTSIARLPVTVSSVSDTRLSSLFASGGGALFCVGAGFNSYVHPPRARARAMRHSSSHRSAAGRAHLCSRPSLPSRCCRPPTRSPRRPAAATRCVCGPCGNAGSSSLTLLRLLSRAKASVSTTAARRRALANVDRRWAAALPVRGVCGLETVRCF